MPDDIQKLDLRDATEQLKAKIQNAFVDLIPEEQWKAMILGELEKFTKPTDILDYNDRVKGSTPPAFQTMAQPVLLAHANRMLKEKLEQEDFFPDGKTLESIIIGWLEANRATLIQSFLDRMVQGLFDRLLSSAATTANDLAGFQVNQAVGDQSDQPDLNNPGYNRKGEYIG